MVVNRAQRLVLVVLVVTDMGLTWWGRTWWDDRREREHCRSLVDQEAALQSKTRWVDTEAGPTEVDDGLDDAERARFLGNVRRGIDRCIANNVPIG